MGRTRVVASLVLAFVAGLLTLTAALRPSGLLIYETFTRRQAGRGKPTNPDFLLEEGELRRLAEPLEIVDYRE